MSEAARHRQALLAPRSIAVLGASDSEGNLGARVVSYARKYGFPGRVHLVNPRRAEVMGQPCFATPRDLPEVPDLAILAVSAAQAEDAVRACIEAGITHGVLWAGGFAETGAEGAAMQERLAALCREGRFALVGPNTLGIIDTHLPLAASFATPLLKVDRLLPGGISMLSQSGGTAIGAFGTAQEAGFGFRCMISSGNEAVLGFADYLRMLAEDAATRVIACYLEGVRDGEDLLDALARVRESGKALVMLKVGAGEAGQRGAAAHTGALTGTHRVWQAVLREGGAILVRSQRELVDVAMLLAAGALPRGDRVALAGPTETAALLRREGLRPVAPDADAEVALLDRTLEEAAPLPARRPLVVAAALDRAQKHALAGQGVFHAPTPERAVEALARVLRRPDPPRHPRPAPLRFGWAAHLPDARAGQVVAEHQCHRILAAAGLEMARGAFARGEEEAAAVFATLGGAVAMKGIAPGVTHRAAAGLLLLDVASAEQARAGFRALAAQGHALEGVYLQRMERGAAEIILAATRDPVFGPVVTLGAGGNATELLDDVVIARAPIGEAAAREMIAGLRITRALGAAAPDPAPLAAFVARFARLAAAMPWRDFALELNPVMWREDAAIAVDGLLIITHP